MERIFEHIERLLLQHDCIIIPDFGGFVLQSISAEYLDVDHFFTPSRKEIIFNPTLTHNDGLLAESYMQQYTLNFAKAQSLVKKDVAEIKKRLDDNSELQFGTIGLFFKEDERLIFMPAKHSDDLFGIQSYGLPVFYFLPLSTHNVLNVGSSATQAGAGRQAETGNETATVADKTFKNGKNVLYNIPVTRTFLRSIAVIAAAILLFLFLATPVSDVNIASYSASFVPPEIMPKKTADEVVTGAFSANNDGMNASTSLNRDGYVTESLSNTPSVPDKETEAVTKTNTTPVTPEPKAETSSKTSSTTSPKAETPSKTETSAKTSSATTSSKASSDAVQPSPTNGKNIQYYVIIGVFDTKARAQKYMNQLKGSETENADILVKDGRARVYARCFSSEKEAESYKAKLRQNPKHAQAWVYKVK